MPVRGGRQVSDFDLEQLIARVRLQDAQRSLPECESGGKPALASTASTFSRTTGMSRTEPA